MAKTRRPQVALLFGGRSGEHAVSLRSAASVASGLSPHHEVLPVLIDRAGDWWLQEGPAPEERGGVAVFLAPTPTDGGRLRRLEDAAVVAAPEIYFPVLHGPFGEDGTVQGLLELAAVPYVGCGVAAAAAAMDKELMRGLFTAAGLPQGAYRVVGRGVEPPLHELIEELGLPLFVKPANLGSSVGVSKVSCREDLRAAVATALQLDRKALVETAIDARELEVSVLGNDSPEASVPGEIFPDREFYDYESKYAADSQTRLEIPAGVTPTLTDEIRRLAIGAFAAVDACGFARVDFFLERKSGRLLVNEINTIPGFTSISMFPKLWEASGLSYGALLVKLIELGHERHRKRRAVRSEPIPSI